MAITTFNNHTEARVHILKNCKENRNMVLRYYQSYNDNTVVTIDSIVCIQMLPEEAIVDGNLSRDLEFLITLHGDGWTCTVYKASSQRLAEIMDDDPPEDSSELAFFKNFFFRIEHRKSNRNDCRMMIGSPIILRAFSRMQAMFQFTRTAAANTLRSLRLTM